MPSGTPTLADDVRTLLNLPLSTALDVADDGTVLFGTNTDGTSQLWESFPDGSQQQLTDFASAATGRYLPGSRKLIVSSDLDGNEHHQLYLLDPDLEQLPVTGLAPLIDDPAHIYQLVALDAHSLVYSTNRRNDVDFDLIRRDADTGAETVLWSGGGLFRQASASPDGRFLVANELSLQPASTVLRLLDVVAGQWAEITAADRPGGYGDSYWTADSSGFFASHDAETDFASLGFFRVADRSWHRIVEEPGVNVSLALDGTGRRALISRLADGKTTLSVCDVGTQTGLPVLGPESPVLFAEEGYARGMLSADGGRLALTFSAPTFPDEVFSADLPDAVGVAPIRPVQRTAAPGREIAARLPRARTVRIPARDGEQIPAFVTDGDASAVLSIHGGPESASLYQWLPRNASMVLAGHTVLVPNVRGSSGYGRRWISMDDVELRLESVKDLVDIHAWLVAEGIDGSRVALYGGSYGGYMVLAGMTFHPEYWAAGVDIVGMSSLVTFMENTSAYRRAYREREYGSLAGHRQVLEEASPLPRIKNLAKPLMVIHGANDPRVPLSEAEQVVAAVRANGSECELLVYPDEGHGLSRRKNQLDAYPRAIEFLRRTLG
ncbi:MAG: S9 family peptidase [Renibacterium salmoninarum]|nr:S9 family peptidase [Renibacterium salmoninarum]